MSKIIFLIFMFATTAIAAPETDKANVFNKNLLENGGFEYGKTKWTASAGTFAVTTSSPMVGLVHATWDAAASADTLTSTAVTVPAGMYGRNGVASCVFTVASGTATHTIQAYDGSNILSSVTITSSTTPTRASANFVFPSSGSISLRVYANADEPSVAIDDCYLGPAEGYNIGNVSQTTLVGSAYFATTASCTFTRTNTALGAMSDADCPGATVELNPGPGAIQTTDYDAPKVAINNLPPGNYEVSFMGGSVISTSAQLASFAINDGTTTAGQVTAPNLTTATSSFKVTGVFNYTTTANRTFELYASSAANAVNIDLTASNQRLYFIIKRYPTSQEQVYSPDKLANSWSGYHDSTCSWARTNTAFGDPSTDTSCALVERTNSNFGTVSGSNSLPSITFTPSRIGRYFVCANIVAGINSTGTASFKLWDGTTTIAAIQGTSTSVGGAYASGGTLCGIYSATTISAKTISLQVASTANTVTVGGGVGASPANSIEWSIFQIDQSFPMPLMANSVTSSSSGVTKVEAANINCDAGSAITSQHGSWVSSVGNASGGACAITLSGGVFSSAPYCTVSPNAAFASVGLILSVTASSATAVSVDCEDDASSACTSYDFNIICVGAK